MTSAERQLLEETYWWEELCKEMQAEIKRLRGVIATVEQVNHELVVERDVTDLLLGAAMRELGQLRGDGNGLS